MTLTGVHSKFLWRWQMVDSLQNSTTRWFTAADWRIGVCVDLIGELIWHTGNMNEWFQIQWNSSSKNLIGQYCNTALVYLCPNCRAGDLCHENYVYNKLIHYVYFLNGRTVVPFLNNQNQLAKPLSSLQLSFRPWFCDFCRSSSITIHCYWIHYCHCLLENLPTNQLAVIQVTDWSIWMTRGLVNKPTVNLKKSHLEQLCTPNFLSNISASWSVCKLSSPRVDQCMTCFLRELSR